MNRKEPSVAAGGGQRETRNWAGARSRGPHRSQGEVEFCSGKNAHDLCTEVFKSKLWLSLLPAVWQAGKQSRSVLKTYKKEDLKPQGLFLKGFKGYPRTLQDNVAHTLLHRPVAGKRPSVSQTTPPQGAT